MDHYLPRSFVFMTKKSNKSNSSRRANLERRIKMIANGLRDATPNTPHFYVVDGKIVKIKPPVPREVLERGIKIGPHFDADAGNKEFED